MVRKNLIAYLILLVMGAQMTAHFGYTKAQANTIPNDAIRLRILANSDSEQDQELKRKVRDRVKEQIDTWVADLRSVEESRVIIQSRIPQLKQTVAQVLQEEHSNQSYQVEFNSHISFPTKVYGNFIYPAGEYEAVLVTLGKGEGANWWCVLFPPLCFLDFGTGTAIQKEPTKVEQTPPLVQAQEEERPTPIIAVKTKTVDKPVVMHSKQIASKVNERVRLMKEEQLLHDEEAKAEAKETQPPTVKVDDTGEPVKVKFFLVEAISSFFSK